MKEQADTMLEQLRPGVGKTPSQIRLYQNFVAYQGPATLKWSAEIGSSPPQVRLLVKSTNNAIDKKGLAASG